ncbi:hypothetical protein DPMN_010198 [Dreissena polymorpha]|jgi:hypothetical protein|uniref:Uncharacterized protein n=1 Tax=Dreissena polymorpha TaxID=45954 RepID=A0A9D3XXF6_DREPO|nr:hypothetical protein DPMN_192137 [Dreissena polymorpha]KAH3722418.1 hypothetical protein DPMN_065377 [Dreissena polymorpha]KAH3728584.1 hypothetical protein DPMN_054542 [Dreissena polymorpha]KAH3749677.1 hypothetical protein DPMN_184183 [Dreissena polymorpha]KAH3795480.1 hypothetical protein DPMN_149034 [Dreissena polymorpha]
MRTVSVQNSKICNPTAGWLLNFVEEKEEVKLPKFIEIGYNFSDSVDLNSETVKDKMSKMMDMLQMDELECQSIEKLTRGQGKNVLWEDERKLRVTASNFGEVILLKQETERFKRN